MALVIGNVFIGRREEEGDGLNSAGEGKDGDGSRGVGDEHREGREGYRDRLGEEGGSTVKGFELEEESAVDVDDERIER